MTETDCRIEPISSTFTATATTTTAATVTATATMTPAKPGPARRIVCWATIAAVLPYLCLKICWLSGSTVGLTNPQLAESSALSALNTLTLGMDSVAALVALALTYRWGRRLPAWMVIAPMWVASGFLGTAILVVPLQLGVDAATGSSFSAPNGFLASWVYLVVYGGFMLQGLGLLIAFALYSKARWSALFASPAARSGIAEPLRVGLAILAALTAVPELYWAFGGTSGLPAREAAAGDVNGVVLRATLAAAALVAVAGAMSLLRRSGVGASRSWKPLVAVWFGSAALFAWGAWTTLVDATASPLNGNAHSGLTAEQLTGSAQAFAGATLALATLVALRRRAGGGAPTRRV
jgi:hypothetical protein